MLTVSDLSKSFNLQTLFENVTFSINPRERIGLIGPNGCGKTTLLRILAGKETASTGQVHHPANLRIGYLPQGFELDSAKTLNEVIGQAVGDVETLESDLTATATALAKNPRDGQLAAHYDNLLQRIQTADCSWVKSILEKLGLSDISPDMLIAHLSGGQKTRLSLAFVLLNEPHILLLDEPTNHLDIGMLEWLEEWLARTSSGALIVSHDRVFLDHTVTRILDLDACSHKIRSYDGNYSAYLEQRQTEIDKKWAAYSDQQQEVRRMKADIARVKAQAAFTERQASSVRIGGPDMRIKGFKCYQQGIAKKVAKKAKAREKRLERYIDSDERVEKPRDARTIRIEFQKTSHLGRSVIQMEGLSIGYEESKPLLRDINLQVRASRRVAISGPNGCGKTTLLRTLNGDLPVLQGKITLGSSVRMGFMSQDLSTLNTGYTVVESVLPAFRNQTEARRFLASYLLTGDEVLKKTTQLSFGQQARLMLALLILEGCNVLLLDEPINHLDIPSRSQFEQALDQFEGAVLSVVHDRYFIRHFAQEVWLVQDGKVIVK